MRSWLIGFVVFGLAYAAIVTAIGIVTWPALESPRFGTFENDLSALQQDQLIEVRIGNLPMTGREEGEPRFSLTTHPDGRLEAVMVNGHLLAFTPSTTREAATEVAIAYADRIEHYLMEAQISQVERLLVVLIVPLVTFLLFAWLARVLWNKLRGVG